MGICQPRQKAGVNNMGGEAAPPANPEKGRPGKYRGKCADFLKDALTRDHKCTGLCPHMNLRLGL